MENFMTDISMPPPPDGLWPNPRKNGVINSTSVQEHSTSKTHGEDQNEEPPFKKSLIVRSESSSEHHSLNLEEMSNSELVDSSRSSTDMFKDALDDLQSGWQPLSQNWIQQWKQLEEEESAILSSMGQEGVNSLEINECLQQQLNDLHKSIAAIVSAY